MHVHPACSPHPTGFYVAGLSCGYQAPCFPGSTDGLALKGSTWPCRTAPVLLQRALCISQVRRWFWLSVEKYPSARRGSAYQLARSPNSALCKGRLRTLFGHHVYTRQSGYGTLRNKFLNDSNGNTLSDSRRLSRVMNRPRLPRPGSSGTGRSLWIAG